MMLDVEGLEKLQTYLILPAKWRMGRFRIPLDWREITMNDPLDWGNCSDCR